MSGNRYNWIGADYGDFNDAGNWYDVTTGAGATTPPGPLDQAVILAEGIIVGPGTVGTLGICGNGIGLTLAETLGAATLDLDGIVNVTTDCALTASNLIDIGDQNGTSIATYLPADVSVASGGYLSALGSTPNAFDVLVGANQGQATLQITGLQAFLSSGLSEIGIGDAGTGVVSVSDGGLIQGGIGGNEGGVVGLALGIAGGGGTLTLSGFASSAIFGDEVVVGAGGTGSLSVASGATLSAGNGTISLLVGTASTLGTGAVTIDSATAYLNGLIDIGDGGSGTLTLSGSDLSPRGNGTAAGLATAVVLGDAGGAGTLAIAANSTLTTTSGLLVGLDGAGASGDLDIAGASLIENIPGQGGAAPALEAGVAAGTTGVVDVSGGLLDDTESAGMIIGNAGSGTLAIAQAGAITQAGAGGEVFTGGYIGGGAGPSGPVVVPFGFGLTIAVAYGSSGDVSVTGGNSALAVVGSVLDGYFGTGVLALADGGVLIAGYEAGAYGLVVGSGGFGTMTLSGAAQADILGETIIGLNGTGTLSVTGGSSFSAVSSLTGALLVAAGIGATGGVLISDPSTYVPLTGALVVGDGGKGSLTVQNRAVVAVSAVGGAASPGIVLGTYASTASGTLSLATGARLTSANVIDVGAIGFGELLVSQASLIVSTPYAPVPPTPALVAGITPGSTGVIDVTGGLIEDTTAAGVVIGAHGSGTLAIAPGGGQGGVVLTGQPGGNGLALGVYGGSAGSVSVSGASCGLGVYGSVSDGGAGAGTITLGAGASFVAGYAPDAAGLSIGGGTAGRGNGSFALGGGAQASVLGSTNVGFGGTGTLTVQGGSSFADSAGGPYTLGIGAAGGQGTMLVSDADTYVPISGGVVVGGSGDGTLTVQNDALLSVSGVIQPGTAAGIILGSARGASGTLCLDTGAQLLATTSLAVGAGGSGLLDVAGGTLTSLANPALGLAAIGAGLDAGSAGTIVVSGGLIEDETSAGMVVGGAGDASLLIGQGGSIGGTVLTGDPGAAYGLSLGVSAGAAGSVSVSGTSSGLGVYGHVLVGGAGGGTLTLADGAMFVCGSSGGANGLVIGGAGGAGLLSLASGAQASVLGEIVVGEAGQGTLDITGGSHLADHITAGSLPSLVIGTPSTGTGNVLISDATTDVSLAGGIQIQSGSLVVQNGATLSVAGAVTGIGTIGLSGNATLALASNATETNSLVFGAGGGSLTAMNAADILGTVTGWSAGDFLSLSGMDATSESFANGTLSLFGANNALAGTLHFTGALASHNFTLSQAGGGGTVIGYHG